MPPTDVVFYCEEDGTAPIVEWLAKLTEKARIKCLVYLARLEAEGHELRRPISYYLRDGIYELRPSHAGVQYRILYFFQARNAVVISHGLVKENTVPAAEIERAIRSMKRYLSSPKKHTFIPGKGE